MLDTSVYAVSKGYYNDACDDWLLNHPRKTISIYDIAVCFENAFSKAFTTNNIKSGFESPGIFPFGRNVFPDDDFLSFFVTDRPQVADAADLDQQMVVDPASVNLNPLAVSCRSSAVVSQQNSASFRTPEDIRPFLKASPMKNNRKGRKRGETTILTDTPTKTIQGLAEQSTDLLSI